MSDKQQCAQALILSIGILEGELWDADEAGDDSACTMCNTLTVLLESVLRSLQTGEPFSKQALELMAVAHTEFAIIAAKHGYDA